MTIRLGSEPIVVGTTQIFNAPSLGVKGLIIDNASPFQLTINLQGSSLTKTLQPAGTDFFEVYSGFNGNVVFSSQAQITNPQSYTNYMLTVDAVGVGENIDTSQFPVARPMPAVTATASGQPIFSATYGIGSSVNGVQLINIYNPANSGVSYQFHSCRIFCDTSQKGMTAAIDVTSGADLNFGTLVPVVSHDCSSTPPISTAHVTGQDGNTRFQNQIIEVLNTQQGITLDFLVFPDQIILRPGNNLTIELGAFSNVTAGTVVRLTAKWTEVPQISASMTGGATTGDILTASTVVNDNNPAGTGVISAFPSGAGGNELFIDNQGNILAASGDMQISADGSGNIIINNLAGKDIILESAAAQIGRFLSTGQFKLGGGNQGGFTRVSTFGSYSINNVSTLYNHNLGAVPDLVLLQLVGGNLGSANYDDTTLTATQVAIKGSAATGLFVRGLAIKF